MTPLAQLLAILSGGTGETAKAVQPAGTGAADGLFAALLRAQGSQQPAAAEPSSGPAAAADLPGLMVAEMAGLELDTAAPKEHEVMRHEQGDALGPEAAVARGEIERALPPAVLRAQSPRPVEVLAALFGDAGVAGPRNLPCVTEPAAIATGMQAELDESPSAQQAPIGEDLQQPVTQQIETGAVPAPNANATESPAPAAIDTGGPAPAPVALDSTEPATFANLGAAPAMHGAAPAGVHDTGTALVAPPTSADAAVQSAEAPPVGGQQQQSAPPDVAEPSAGHARPRQPAAIASPVAPQPIAALPVAPPRGAAPQASPTGSAAEAADADTGAPMQHIKAPLGEDAARPPAATERPVALALAARVFDPASGRAKPDIVSPARGDAAAAEHGPPPRAQAVAPALVQPQAAQPAPHAPGHILAVQIAAKALNGHKRFDIRLDPPELGRVNIRIDVARAGKVTAHLVVERAETLDLLQRDARTLERALQQAGLDTTKDGLTFSLKDHGLARRDGEHGPLQPRNEEARAQEHLPDDDGPVMRRAYVAPGRIDIRI